jgi:hypothetical protein
MVDNCPARLGRIDEIKIDPCLTHDSLALKRFLTTTGPQSCVTLSGNQHLLGIARVKRGEILAIFYQGWKPPLRAGQTHGLGEYFGCTANVSAGYSALPVTGGKYGTYFDISGLFRNNQVLSKFEKRDLYRNSVLISIFLGYFKITK